MVRFAFEALPWCCGFTWLLFLPAICFLRTAYSKPAAWALAAVIGFCAGAAFLCFWAGDSMEAPTSSVYLIYGAFGLITASAAQLIGFASPRAIQNNMRNHFPQPTPGAAD